MAVSNKVALKSGMWYMVGDILFRTIGFITTPIFARVLSKSEFGQFNNILSWSVILFFIFSMDLHSSIIRSKLDYEDDLASYATSVLSLSIFINICGFLIVRSHIEFFTSLFSIESKYINILFMYLVFLEAYYIFITYERAFYRYKNYTIATGIVIVSVNIISLILVVFLDNKLDARVYGYFIPYTIIGFIMTFLIIHRKPKIKIEYIKYALAISLPLLPHLISLNILSTSDRVMITQMIGKEENAIYSIAYLFSNILLVIYTAMNKAWAPWFLDTLKEGNKSSIKTYSKYYFLFFLLIVLGAALLAPEAIYILGGKKYSEATFVFLPLLIATVFQFGYTLFIQIEIFEKKLKAISIATSCAALVNITLNLFLLERYGYVIAGYTTLIGYIICYLIHLASIKLLGQINLLDIKFINGSTFGSILLIPCMFILYRYIVLRYFCIFLVFVIVMYFLAKNPQLRIKNFR